MGQMVQGCFRRASTASEAFVDTKALAGALPLDPTGRTLSFRPSCRRASAPLDTLTRSLIPWTLPTEAA